MENFFLWKIAKSRPFEGKGFLNNYVFLITNKGSPLMKDDLGSVWGPTQRLQKKIEKKNESEEYRNHAHSHTYTWCIAGRTAARNKKDQDRK